MYVYESSKQSYGKPWFQASQKFAELYLSDLGTQDQEFLSVNYDAPVPYIVPRSEDKEELKRVLKEALPEEEKKIGGIVSKFKGEKIEVQVQKKIKAELSTFTPKLSIASFKREEFCKFKTGRASGCGEKHEKNQEFDMVVLLPQCRVFLVVEVKSEAGFSKKDLEKIKRTSER